MRFTHATGIVVLAFCVAACDPADKQNRGQFGAFTAPSPAASMRISGATQLLVGQHETYELIVTTASGFSSAVIDGVYWSSSDSQVLSNSGGRGAYEAVASGSANVDVFYGSQRATLRVIVIGEPQANVPPPTSPAPPPAPPAPAPPPPAAPGLEIVNGTWTIRSSANPDPCAGFPFNYDGTITLAGVRSDGVGGSAILNRTGSSSPLGSNVTVRREGSRFIVEFTARLAIGGNFYDYAMRWELSESGTAFTGTQTLSGPCQSTSTVQGTKS